jgi:hypothetical protein
MTLSPAQLKHSVELATEIANRYANQYPGLSASPVRDIESLLWMCSVYVEQWIRSSEADNADLNVNSMAVWATTIVMADGYEIYYVQGLDEFWLRFVVAKEAFHVVLDSTAVRNMDLMGHIVEMAAITSSPVAAATMTPAAAVEMMAEIAAMEFLFPYAKRLEELNNGEKDWSSIAAKYKVPQHFVELYLSTTSMDELRPYHV